MGFVGGGGDIAIAIAIFFVYFIINIKQFLTLARSVLFLVCAEYSVVMGGAWPGILVT